MAELFIDLPFDKAIAQARKLISKGAKVYQKYTCSGCGARLGIEEPNLFYESGTCNQCNTITNIKQQGCGFMIYVPVNRH